MGDGELVRLIKNNYYEKNIWNTFYNTAGIFCEYI